MKKIIVCGFAVIFFLSQGYYGNFSETSVVGKAAALDQNDDGVPPVIEVLPDVSSGIAPLTVHFEGVAYDDGKICGLEWDFEGDGVFDLVHDLRELEGKERVQALNHGLKKVHTFENPGIFHVLVRATDDTEKKATTSVTIQVHSDRPWLDISPSNTDTTSTTIPAASFVQGLNTIQFKESNTYSTKFEWVLYIDQGCTPQEYITSFTNDNYGNRTSITNAEGNTATSVYSADYGHAYITSVTNAVGSTVSASYDFASGHVLSITNSEGFTTTYEYDLLGRITKNINADLSEKEIVYDDALSCVTIYDELDHFTKKYFDGLGRITKIEYFLDGQLYATETLAYNYMNKLTVLTDPLGYTYARQYDSKGRSVVVENPDGTSKTIQYNDITNIVTISDENQHTKQVKFNWNNQLLWVKEFIDQANYYFTQYTYDQAGNLITQTDANGNTTMYEHDSLFGLTQVIYPDLTTEVFTYDNIGNLTSRTDANSTVTYQYDAVSQVTQIQYPGGTITFDYDLNGNRTVMTDPAGTSTYVYDSRNRLISETRTIDGVAYTVESEYNAISFPISITYPDDTTITFVYDDLNRVITIPGYAEFTYNVNSAIETIVYGNGVQTDFTYDCFCGRPTQMHATKNGNDLLNLFYTYDAAGNITQLENGISNPETQTFETFTELYTYDWLNRLTSATTDLGSFSYDYDAVGNRTSLNGAEYYYNSLNQLSSMDDGTTFSYDQNGNMLSKTGTDTWTYQYDYADQLIDVQYNGQVIGQYTYDGDGRRIQKTEWIQSMEVFQSVICIYNGYDVFYEKNTDTEMEALYVHGPTGRIAKKAGGAIHYYHTDHLRSTRLITDENGTVVTAENYQPFGINENKGEPAKYLFTGKEKDASQLYYYGARYYSPELGRFLTRDPNPGELTNPQSLNRYVYCLNNPLRYTDKWGLSVSSGSGDCDCIDEVKDLLVQLDEVNQVIDALEKEIDQLYYSLALSWLRHEECLDFINDMGFQVPALIFGGDVDAAEGIIDFKGAHLRDGQFCV